MKKSQVVSRLKRMVAWDQEPVLDEEDIDYLVSIARAKDINGYAIEDTEEWERLTSYQVGVVVINEQRDKFIAVVAGLSGTTPLDKATPTQDGTVVWEYVGSSSWTPTYDLNKAAYEGWVLKAAKATSMISFTSDGARFDRDQYLANCQAMQRQYAQNHSARSRRCKPVTWIGHAHDYV